MVSQKYTPKSTKKWGATLFMVTLGMIAVLIVVAMGLGSAQPAAALQVTATPTPAPVFGEVVAQLINVRAGPGVEYAVIGQLKRGDTFKVIGTNLDQTWVVFELTDLEINATPAPTRWISGLPEYVKLTGGDPKLLPTVLAPPTPTLMKTRTATATRTSGRSGGSAVTDYPAMPKGLTQARVVRVVDGDTVDISLNGTTERVRLIGINTPETVDPNRPVGCYGPEASARAHKLLDGQRVFVEPDSSQDTRDKYGRLLAYFWFADGRLYNMQMVREGFAFEYTYNVPYKYQFKFKVAQREAKLANRGLWSPQTCNGKT